MPEEKIPLYRTLSAPIDVQIELTTACDNTCRHCYNFWREDNTIQSTLSSQQLSHVVNELGKNKIFSATLTGGEPLLFDDRAVKTIEQASQNNITSTLNSNLTHLTPEKAQSLRSAGLKSVLTSLTSFDERTHNFITQKPGSFQRTINGIKHAQEAGIPVAVNMAVSKLNQNQVYKTGNFVASLGVETFCATKASPPLNNKKFSALEISDDDSKKMLDDLLLVKHDFGVQVDALEPYPSCFLQDLPKYQHFTKRQCQAALTSCTIGADGSVRPCSHSDKVYGNILQDGLEKPWKNMQEWRNGTLIPALCQDCNSFALCGGGCRVNAETHTGNLAGIDPMAKNPAEIIPLDKESIEPPLNFAEKTLVVSPQFKFRPEEFGGIVDGEKDQPFLVNEKTYQILMDLREKGKFTANDIPGENAKNVFWHLANQQIVVEK